jgi:glycosyltransferase family protein
MVIEKIKKEFERFKKKMFYSGKKYKQLERFQYEADNLPYEVYDKVTNLNYAVQIPKIKTTDETLNKILKDRCSLARFGDGEFGIMNGSRIHFQNRSPELGFRLKEVIDSDIPNLLIALPDCFGSLDHCLPEVTNFWRKWMFKKRNMAYSYLSMDRTYYNAFFTRVYIMFNKTDKLYKYCGDYFEKMKKIWLDRNVVICEGQGTRFGMFNDLLSGAKSISRILCPARSAFDKYDDILSAFKDIGPDALILIALGPTATVLAYDLCNKGYQAIDIGQLDLDYEWFLKKETRLGAPLEFKYVDSGPQGRKIQQLQDPTYKKQIIKTIF